MNYDQNNCQQFSFITPLFPTLANTLKTKVGDVVGCIFDVECSVGGFLILKQIIVKFTVLMLVAWSVNWQTSKNKSRREQSKLINNNEQNV
jgi:hypothetical protein